MTAIRRFLKLANDETSATGPHDVLMVINADTTQQRGREEKKNEL
jgi:hypothetical protein